MTAVVRALFALSCLASLCISCAAEPVAELGEAAVATAIPATSTPRPTPAAAASATAVPATASPACQLDGTLAETGATPGPMERLIAPQVVDLPQPYEPAAFREDPALGGALQAALGDKADSYAFVVKDLSSGWGASHNADSIFYAASLYKLFVMYEILRQESLGLLQLTDEVTITSYYDSYGLGPRGTYLCQRLTLREALVAMTSQSDNAAAVLLQDLAGSGNINKALAALGLRQSRLLTDDLPVTATDIALLLEMIGNGDAVSPDASEDMMLLMQGEEFDNGLRAGLPAGVSAVHKTGNWSNATHDAGIVFAPMGAYLIVVLSSEEHETRVIKEISRLAYQHFAAQ
ncbi:MAG: hypothetical protein GEU75_11750 [Dehalococcoidia bacterium]|nr:hypothetical protein [Dehalococcoidia bacterium]